MNGRSGRRIVRVVGVVALVALAGAVNAQAQERPRPTPQDRAEMEARVRAQIQRMVKERLELTDAQSEELAAVADGFEEQRRALRRSEMETRRRVETLMEGGQAAEGEAEELLQRIIELRRQEADLFAEEQAAFLEVLPAGKVLQLQALREEMGRRIRDLRRGRRGERRPGGDREGNVVGIPGVDLSGHGN